MLIRIWEKRTKKRTAKSAKTAKKINKNLGALRVFGGLKERINNYGQH